MFVLMLPTAMRGMQADFARHYRELIAFRSAGHRLSVIASIAGSVSAGWLVTGGAAAI
jgi:hypothetical protein